jgi:hypothetical protein
MRTRPHAFGLRLVAAPASALVALATMVGCSSGSGESGTSDAAALIPTADQGLAGQYVADDSTTSDFSSITFVDDTRYILQPTTCPDSEDCREQGWYTISGDEVSLHDDLGDTAEVYPLSVLSSGIIPAATDDAGTDSDAGVTITMSDSDGTATTQSVDLGIAGLVTSGGSIVGSNQVYSLRMGKSSYHLVNSAGQLVTKSNAGSLVSSSGPLVGSKIAFEGSCSFLHSCSSFSKKLPAGEVSWGCTGVAVCSDTAHWLAGPTRAYCGKTVTVCKGSSCTTGTVLDVSNASEWEGSEGLLGAIGIPYSITGACSGTGGGTVTIHD